MNGFISYSHDDYGLFEEFKDHLRATERECGIQFWADHRIAAGYDWSTAIADAIAAADVCLMLVSAQFIASDYIYDTEIPAMLRRRNAGALFIPVVLRKCSWAMLAGSVQAVPTIDGHIRPVTKWRPKNDGFDQARDQITRSIKSHFGLTPSPAVGSAP